VVITPRADRSQFFARTTTGAVGVLVAAESAEIVFDVAANRSEANGCDDLAWELTKPAGSSATISCDEARPSVAILRLGGGAHEYSVSLVVVEPSGLRTRSNVFRVAARADDGKPVLLFLGSPVVSAYVEHYIYIECRQSLFGPECFSADLRCAASAPVVIEPETRVAATDVNADVGPRCIVSLTGGQAVLVTARGLVDGVMTESEPFDLRAQ
jgi:hypothetical protein